MKVSVNNSITVPDYANLQAAFDFFNRTLWAGKLPQVMLTYQRKPGAKGYYSHDRFSHRLEDGRHASEIALNPDLFAESDDREILSTLVHEMAHLWQFVHGTAPRKCYHDKQFSTEMERVGLWTTADGTRDGRRIGSKMTHLILDGGLYDKAYAKMADTGFKLNWNSNKLAPAVKKSAGVSKVKYQCYGCDTSLWGAPGKHVLCGDCIGDNSEPLPMVEQ
jgi:hypothetical protein